MSFSRSVALVFLGVILGVSLTIGTYYGIKEYGPGLAMRYLSGLLGTNGDAGKSLGSASFPIDSSAVRSIVQDILSSDEGKAIVSELMRTQSKETFQTFFEESLKSPEFRQALSDGLNSFLSSPEGKALLKRIAAEAMNP